ncbi:MAG: FAD-binding domain-containing protein, partial [Longimicrobiales bacterium]|nr:FAD-binding domain-containing protein [Longimicrobiales bacterium]
TGDDSFYSVYSPFHRRWRSMGTPDPLSAPDTIPTPDLPSGFDLGDIDREDPDVELPEPGEAAALRALEAFVEDGLARYGDERDRLDGSGTSRLSPYITLGVLSPRTAAVRSEAAGGGTGSPGSAKWLAELCWRDFMADLLYHRPDLLDTPFRSRWSAMEWTGSDADFEAWRDGRTGVPAVDAAMRQLRETGWISNRSRMVAAQFLAKNLRVDWRRGEAVFKDWLLDGDTSSNVGNWQWAAGLGVDNAPYFRVMSPVSQAEKHDPDGSWLREWAPYSEGDPSPQDPVVDPKASRKAYLEAAKGVPGADDDPPIRRPRLDLATPAQLQVIDGVGPETAGAIADGLARGKQLRDIPGVGPEIADAVRARFAGG